MSELVVVLPVPGLRDSVSFGANLIFHPRPCPLFIVPRYYRPLVKVVVSVQSSQEVLSIRVKQRVCFRVHRIRYVAKLIRSISPRYNLQQSAGLASCSVSRSLANSMAVTVAAQSAQEAVRAHRNRLVSSLATDLVSNAPYVIRLDTVIAAGSGRGGHEGLRSRQVVVLYINPSEKAPSHLQQRTKPFPVVEDDSKATARRPNTTQKMSPYRSMVSRSENRHRHPIEESTTAS
ncbi:AAEL000514-PA [Aedes aegypti]|uniref:AAEL000514-PA n=1 Tax=Aedes aegypti TaxID=7159 RepID=Q17P60_AEDAE|nr:AAEL000514-PA [Aedes aegypti]